MAIAKVFPVSDTTLYSAYADRNTGRDEITEISMQKVGLDNSSYPTRILLNFDKTQIRSFTTRSVDNQLSLRSYLANGSALPKLTVINVHPMAESWDVGTGKYSDSPKTTNGASWLYSNGSSLWNSQNIHYPSKKSYIQAGGGSFLTSSTSTQLLESFNQGVNDDYFDLNVDVTNLGSFLTGSTTLHGLVVKYDDATENSTGSIQTLRYFSLDTNTIYPPHLEVKWNDFLSVTSSAIPLYKAEDGSLDFNISNNKGKYSAKDIVKFRIDAKPQFPTRVFSTSSIYTNQHYLPTTSYWSIKDLDTNEDIFKLDTKYTQISADAQGSYFTVYMDGLEPERWYKLLIRTDIGDEQIVHDNKQYFKIVNSI